MPIEKEVLLERIRYLRDLQRFYEGLTAVLSGFVLYAMSNLGLQTLIVSSAVVIASYIIRIKHRRIREEIEELWDEVMRRDPRNSIDIPLIGIIIGVAGIIVGILYLLGIIP